MTSKDIEAGDVQRIGKALSSKTRWKILKMISKEKMDVSRIAEKLGQTEANISAQIKILEKSGLILSHYEPDTESFPITITLAKSLQKLLAFSRLSEHGVRKICEPSCASLTITIISDEN